MAPVGGLEEKRNPQADRDQAPGPRGRYSTTNGLRAYTVTPRVSNSFASPSCSLPENTTTGDHVLLPHRATITPVRQRTAKPSKPTKPRRLGWWGGHAPSPPRNQ